MDNINTFLGVRRINVEVMFITNFRENYVTIDISNCAILHFCA